MNKTIVKSIAYTPSLPLMLKQSGLAYGIRCALAGSLALGAHAVLAQSADEAESESMPIAAIEEVEVVGIRASMRSAIDRKKAAGTATDSIVAEDIGQFPDKNVSEALQRVTGVQIGREFGEGTSVSIRGVEPQLVNVEVNGQAAIGASDPFASAGRSVDFASMASELVKALDVIKGSEARLTEGGIGGTIQVVTRKPNDFDEHYFQLSAENQYNDLMEANSQKYNLTGVYKFTEKVGGLLNVTMADRQSTYHALRNTEWVRQADYDNSPDKTFEDPDYANITDVANCPDSTCEAQWYDFRARIPRTSIWERDEDRLSANGMLQFELSDSLSAHVGYTYNTRDFVQVDSNMQLEVASESNLDPNSFTVGANHNASSFVTEEATIVNRAVHNDWKLESGIFDAGFDFDAGNLNIQGSIGHSTQDQKIYQRESRVNANGVGNVLAEFSGDGSPVYDLDTGLNSADPSQTFTMNEPESYWFYSRIYDKPIETKDELTTAKLDLTYNFDDGFITKLRTGFRISKEDIGYSRSDRRITRIIGNDYGGDTWTLEENAALISRNSYMLDNFLGSYDAGVPVIDGWLGFNAAGFYNDFLATHAGNISADELAIPEVSYYDVERNIQALYLQLDFATEVAGLPVWGNVGARYVRTEADTSGNALVEVQVDVDPSDPSLGNVLDPNHPMAYNDERTLSNDYSDFLPSLNVNLGIIPDQLILYAGAAKVMAHPKGKDLNIAATCLIRLDTESLNLGYTNTCSAGNPRLDPYRAKQLDLAINWYATEDTFLSAALFKKELDTWVLERDEQFGVNYFNDGTLYDVTQVVNGSGATTEGYELTASTFFSSLPGILQNTGVSANFTHLEGEDTGLFNQLTNEELPLPSQSEDSYNITLFYETDMLSVKLAYNYRDAYLHIPADRGGNPVYVDDAGFLDAKVVFRPQGALENFKFYVDARNLTEEGNVYLNGPGRLSENRYSGRELTAGFTYSM
ncbi:TonB-dependent receptor [Halioxenophilus aromaticivorans]|uniref:TonB-dependent receptor n=1 Tax=Halioxenophilus aromaticivorans TaxID=1306992 RepID=A0AAV3U7E9_9ALTE